MQLADHLAEPMGTIGMGYYFCPQAQTRAKDDGSHAAFLYAAGRGGVLGDVDIAQVEDAFYFFQDGMIANLYEKGTAVYPRDRAVEVALEVAAQYAVDTFGDVDPALLSAFVDAASSLFDTLPKGRWPLVDGYLAQGLPEELVPRAYFCTIVLRELRGGVHIDAVKAAGLSAKQACQLDRGGFSFALHGYNEDDKEPETPELIAARDAAERDTTARMAQLFDALSEDQRDALAAGSDALLAVLPQDET